jgi:uncharacterized repeat protein (TIGR02543 family)
MKPPCKWLYTFLLALTLALSACGGGGGGGGGGSNNSEPPPPPAHTVSFDANGADNESSLNLAAQSVPSGALAADPGNPTKSGYSFSGWFRQGVAWTFAADPVTSDMTLIAEWNAIVHHVSFDANGADNESSLNLAAQSVQDGALATPPGNAVKAGHTFAGWYHGNALWDFSQPVGSDMTLTARWQVITYTVTFDATGAENAASLNLAAQRVQGGAQAVDPGNATKSGHTFSGWYHGNAEWDFADPVSSDMKLTARWDAIIHTVAFDANGADNQAALNLAAQRVQSGARASDPGYAARSGYAFAGWFDGNASLVRSVGT